jgi:hypothetical protein
MNSTNISKLFITTVLIFTAYTLSAQESVSNPGSVRLIQQARDGGFSVHVGGAFPVGNFGEEPMSSGDDPFDTGRFSASPGFNVGIKGKFPIAPNNGLGIFLSADLIYNGLKGMARDQFDDAEAEGIEVTRPKYLNIPVFAGLNYRYDFTPTTGLWIESGVGPSFRMITNMEMSGSEDGYTYTERYKYKMQTAFGLQVGGGIMLNDQISIGVHYYGLGKAKIKEELRWTENESGTSESGTDPYTYPRKSAQNSIIIRLGYHF